MILNREYHLHLSLSRFYPLILGAMAFALMISALIPFEVVLIPAIAASPEKWKRHCFASVIGSAIGATALAAIFLYFGWPLITHLFPDLVESRGWLWPRDWIMNYGAIALMILAALPIAQAPALILAGLFHVPLLYRTGRTTACAPGHSARMLS